MLVRFGLPEEVVVNLVKALQARGDEVVAFEMQKEVRFLVLLSLLVTNASPCWAKPGNDVTIVIYLGFLLRCALKKSRSKTRSRND